jgi:hypothetical protein
MKALYKNWNKNDHFAILDFMVPKSCFAWNMFPEELQERFKVKRSQYYAALAEELVAYVDETEGEIVGVQTNLRSGISMGGHNLILASNKEKIQCTVCKWEEKWMDACKLYRDCCNGNGSRQQGHLAVCELCGISIHSFPVPWHRRIFGMEPLKGLSCFQIEHSEYCVGLWIGKK